MASRGFPQTKRIRIAAIPGGPPIVLAGGALLGLMGGFLAEKHASYALLLAFCILGLVSLTMLGDRAFAWAIVLVSVAPWYPLVSHEAVPPVVKQKVLCATIAAAVLVPWLWSVARERNRGPSSRSPSSRTAFLLGILYACFLVLIYETLGSVSAMISSTIVGFLVAGVAFLCARRFTDIDDWPAAAFTGLAILVLLGMDAYASARGNRVGYFSGHPITYGALMVGLTPAALLWARRHSRLLTAAVATASATFLLLSESRSSWVAMAAVLLIVLLLAARRADLRALMLIAALTLVVAGVILGTGTLGSIVERKLGPNLTSSQSYTHRLWSVSYATKQIEQHPLLGAGAPGFSAREASNRTSIGAIDNGYLSISVDMGLIGLLAAAVPILVAAYVIARCLLFGLSPPAELSLALGVIGIAVVTAFYDSFYWAQLDLLLGAMGGVLSTRVNRLATTGPRRVPRRLRETHATRTDPALGGAGPSH